MHRFVLLQKMKSCALAADAAGYDTLAGALLRNNTSTAQTGGAPDAKRPRRDKISHGTNKLLGEVSPPVPEALCRFIVNVSAMEGKFHRHKLATHPHTNMAKAALNMMTRTSAQDYADMLIFMNAVDTGWSE